MTTTQTNARRLYVSMVVSLDGYIEGPNGELDWFLDGDPQFEQYADEMLDSTGVALYGRRAYELMVSYWPQAEQTPGSPRDFEFARKMNALPKVVLSTTLKHAKWNNTTVISERVEEHIRDLKSQPGKAIVAWAGAKLCATLTRLGLVDEYRLIVCPVLLGGGTPYFADKELLPKLRLVRTTQLGSSIAVLCYEPLKQ